MSFQSRQNPKPQAKPVKPKPRTTVDDVDPALPIVIKEYTIILMV